MKQVLLVDDHQMLLEGTASLLENSGEYTVTGWATSGKAALELIKSQNFDVLITDFQLPDLTGLEIVKAARKVQPEIKVLILSMHDEPSVVRELLQENIDGFVVKSDPQSSVIKALEKVDNGKKYFSDDIAEMLVQNFTESNTDKTNLSPRETEIVRLIARDFSTKQISEVLFISEKTVETHRKNILRKTSCSSVVGLVNYAHLHKIV